MKAQSVKMLLDTNVLIQIEDNQKINRDFAVFSEKCQLHAITCFIHDATTEDINKDRDITRREIILSKTKKYPSLEKIPSPSKAELIAKYGHINKDNDYIDVKLLHALDIKVANFLITEDNGIRARAKRAGLEDRVLSVQEAVEWMQETYEAKTILLPYIKPLKCHQVDTAQKIFETLKSDYTGFTKWFNKCIQQHRDCWTVQEENEIIAITIIKPESGKDFKKDFVEEDVDVNDDDSILKLCTFKVDTSVRGNKIGEHLLKQSLWYSYENNFDWIYLTAFKDRQSRLIALFEEFGFAAKGKNSNGEIILAKPIFRDNTRFSPHDDHKALYPNYYDGHEVQKFFIPIQPQFHLNLFPEYTPTRETELSTLKGMSQIRNAIPGNTIRKVYLSRTKTKNIKIGDIVFFYISKNDIYRYSQCITTVGVVDGFKECKDLAELLETTAKRSVFSYSDLEKMFNTQTTPVKAIDFLIAGHIKTTSGMPPDLRMLCELEIVRGVPQSITKMTEDQYQNFKRIIQVTRGSNRA